ncbi:hypothetical protein KQ941_01830 [Paenibacillus xylanexedens]|uniref:hypothetical protein n=1 Tax=Paenibacillus xylanexedens TaxID=528191 RepID=UPI001F44516E|nr:hypothetical protein [Paenibacillus xylanexedens]MCF7753165.1 hypothetical protein [Paenibacillus xylanexedens]
MSNEFDLLFERLKWPSGLVRERACSAIAELLCDLNESEKTFEYLRKWIEAQKLESISLYGILILYKARSIKSDLHFPKYITTDIFKPSILGNLMLLKLNMQPIEINDSFYNLQSKTVPKSHESFFVKNLNVYPGAEEAGRIDQKFKISFFHHWLHEWSSIVSELNLKLSRKSFDYWGRSDAEHYTIFDVMFSEVYRSAFLRSLAWAVKQHNFNLEVAYLFALRNSPVDFGLWNLEMGSKPDDWPFVEMLGSGIDTTPSQIWHQVNELWSNYRISSRRLVHASGVVHSSDNLVYHLKISGVLQKSNGKDKPDIEKINNQLERNSEFGPIDLTFNGQIKKDIIQNVRSGDWLILPLTKNVVPATIPRWQFWRVGSIHLPYGTLSRKALEYQCTEESIQILEQGSVIGEWRDWMYDFTEKSFANLPHNTGSMLYLDQKFIESLCEEKGMTFVWICKITCYSRNSMHEKYKELNFYDQIGGTNIVLP